MTGRGDGDFLQDPDLTDLTSLTLAEARDRLKSRAISSIEITRVHLEAMERAKALNAYIVTTAEKALEMAAASDARLALGEGGPLEGLPIGVKDLYATEGVHTQACSHILDGFKPTYELTVTANLWRDGAVMLGKLNMDEFAMGSSNETSYYGPVASPWLPPNWSREKALAALADGKRGMLSPGGSSGGSSAAVAARLCLAATASDTGGSIRQPAAFTGVVGIKPTYGRCSRWGMVAFASSLDQAGPLARTVRDAAIMLRSMAGPDPKDSTCSPAPVPDYEAAVGRSVKGLTIGVPKEYRLEGMNPEIEALWAQGAEWLRAAGARLVEVSLPNTRHALPAYYIVAPAEASSNLARYDGVRYGLREPASDIVDLYEKTRAKGFGAEVRRRLMIGAYVLSAGYYDAYYLRAQKIPHPHQARLRTGLRRRRRRDPDAGDALGRLRHRREGFGRPCRDVPQRRLHGDGQHGGSARTCRACRPLQRGTAARTAAHRPPVRRGDAVRPRGGDRAVGRAHEAARAVVGVAARIQCYLSKRASNRTHKKHA